MSNLNALLIDFLLIVGFGVQHSVLATLRVKAVVRAKTGMQPLAWRSVESMSNIVYVLVATALWQRTDIVVWSIDGPTAITLYVALGLSWAWYWYLHLVEYDCGLAFGSTTLVAQRAGAKQPRLENWTVGSRRWIRFPVHTAFFGMFFFLPHMSAELLMLAIVLNIYNVYGSILYDRRLKTTIPDNWMPYVDKTGLIWPPVYREPGGAKDTDWPSPVHWRSPIRHLPGLAVGLLIGAGYLFLLGPSPWGPVDMVKALGSALLAAALGGWALGRICRPYSDDWGQRQTDLSTTVALASAVGVGFWVLLSLALHSTAPTFGAYLSMWFTVQYFGHLAAYVAAPQKWKTADMVTSEPVCPEVAAR